VRQSSLAQLQDHQESTRRQYELQQRAWQLGWARERIVVVDAGLGHSASDPQALLNQQWTLRREAADYAVRLAKRRYEQVDPENRLVARTLDQAWEDLSKVWQAMLLPLQK
jgi:hypothetical protein